MSGNTETSVMDQILDRAIEQNPHSKELLKAFGPIIARQRQLVNSINLPKLDYSSIDKVKLRAGVSVIEQINLFAPDDPLTEIALSLTEAVKEALPKLAGELDRLSDLIQKDKLCLADYFATQPGDENKTMARWGNDLKISPSNMSFLLSLIERVLLERRAREATAALGEFAWEKGYCPVCGDFPSIALIEEDGGKRFLHCSSCGQEWRYTRVICPYCEKEAPKEMDYFYVENKTQESAFVCDQCKKYLVTLYRAGRLHVRDMDISAIALVHMDMIMQDKGYEPMTACPWNILK
ncbi:MAG: formate dehydrogenase accessory protein FdhE [Smithellaceae bacterium]|nr:formate dehydrogenase accessory protein FdhE [Smithellaceae bacterium]